MNDLHLAFDKFLKAIGAYSFVSDEDIELAARFRRLPRQEQDLLRLVNLDNLTIDEAARRMGLKTEDAQALLDQAEEQLRADERWGRPVAHQDASE